MCVMIYFFHFKDFLESGSSLYPENHLSLKKTALKDTRSLDAGVFDIFYNIPLARNEMSVSERSHLVVFVFRVCVENSTKYIVQVNKFF